MNKGSVLLTIPIFLIFIVAILGVVSAANDTIALTLNTSYSPIIPPSTSGRLVSNTADIPPTITILGDNPAIVLIGTQYVDARANAYDSHYGNLTLSMLTVNSVNTGFIGVYNVTYVVSNLGGNRTTAVRIVNVVADLTNVTAPAVNNTNTTTNANQATTTPATPSASSVTNSSSNPFTGAATTAAANTPITGGAIGDLTSTWGIVGIIAFVVLIIIVIAVVRKGKKNKNNNVPAPAQ